MRITQSCNSNRNSTSFHGCSRGPIRPRLRRLSSLLPPPVFPGNLPNTKRGSTWIVGICHSPSSSSRIRECNVSSRVTLTTYYVPGLNDVHLWQLTPCLAFDDRHFCPRNGIILSRSPSKWRNSPSPLRVLHSFFLSPSPTIGR